MNYQDRKGLTLAERNAMREKEAKHDDDNGTRITRIVLKPIPIQNRSTAIEFEINSDTNSDSKEFENTNQQGTMYKRMFVSILHYVKLINNRFTL